MRHRLVVVPLWLVLLATALPVAAQPRPQRLEIGTQFGRGVSELTVDGARVDESKTGIFFGFLASARLAGPFALQGELNLSVKGGRTLGEVEGQPLLFDIDLIYLQIPVYLVARSPRIGELIGFRVYGGGSLEPLVGCQLELVGSPGASRPDCRDLVAGLDLGLAAGAGVDVYLTGLTIRADLRRTDGQRRINPDATTAVRNRTTVLSVALMLF